MTTHEEPAPAEPVLPFPDSSSVDDFFTVVRRSLTPHGFRLGTCLPMVCTCRDELTFPVKQHLAREWGPVADLSSLAGVVVLGTSGWQAVAGHAPDDGGTRRLLVFVLPHLGVDASGTPGQVTRPGLSGTSAACGALTQIHSEIAAGRTDAGRLDDGDAELALLRRALMPGLTADQTSSLVALTEAARDRSVQAVRRVGAPQISTAGWDVAIVAGVLVHTPTGPRIAGTHAWLSASGAGLAPLSPKR